MTVFLPYVYKRAVVVSLGALVCSFVPSLAQGMDLVDLVKKVEPAVVQVNTDSALGSGVVVSDQGIILTNFHVVDGAKRAHIKLRSGKLIDVLGFLAADPTHDLAILKTNPFSEPVAIKLAETLPPVGEKVAAFGNPIGFSFTASEGIVSAIRSGQEVIGVLGQDLYSQLGYAVEATWVQTTAAISHGNSGGPLVNMNAEVIGLNTWGPPEGQNLNFAISVSDIRRLFTEDVERAAVKDLSKLPSRRPKRNPKRPLASHILEIELPTGRTYSSEIFRIDSSMSGIDRNAVIITRPSGAMFAVASQQNGLLHGTTIATYENKELMVYADYFGGKRHGLLKTWNPSGKPVLFAQYAKGKRHGFTCFFEKGELRLLNDYKNDELTWVQLIEGDKALDGFANRSEAEKKSEALELLTKLDQCEATLKTNEVAFRKQVAEFEQARRRALAAQLSPQKRQSENQRAVQQEARSAAAMREFYRAALGR